MTKDQLTKGQTLVDRINQLHQLEHDLDVHTFPGVRHQAEALGCSDMFEALRAKMLFEVVRKREALEADFSKL